jgi:hypothetical protein
VLSHRVSLDCCANLEFTSCVTWMSGAVVAKVSSSWRVTAHPSLAACVALTEHLIREREHFVIQRAARLWFSFVTVS